MTSVKENKSILDLSTVAFVSLSDVVFSLTYHGLTFLVRSAHFKLCVVLEFQLAIAVVD